MSIVKYRRYIIVKRVRRVHTNEEFLLVVQKTHHRCDFRLIDPWNSDRTVFGGTV